MTALAFLFSVFLARPCPFYILDEVEAALDDITSPFLKLLRTLRRPRAVHRRHPPEAHDGGRRLPLRRSMAGNGVSKVSPAACRRERARPRRARTATATRRPRSSAPAPRSLHVRRRSRRAWSAMRAWRGPSVWSGQRQVWRARRPSWAAQAYRGRARHRRRQRRRPAQCGCRRLSGHHRRAGQRRLRRAASRASGASAPSGCVGCVGSLGADRCGRQGGRARLTDRRAMPGGLGGDVNTGVRDFFFFFFFFFYIKKKYILDVSRDRLTPHRT